MVAASYYGYACNSWGLGSFQDKNKQNGTKHRENPRGNVVQSAFHQTLGDEFTFQQDNYLKHKAKSTLELLTKKTVNYSFYLNLLENLWQDLQMVSKYQQPTWQSLKNWKNNNVQILYNPGVESS